MNIKLEMFLRKILGVEKVESTLPPFKEGVKTVQPDVHLSSLTDAEYLQHFGPLKERI